MVFCRVWASLLHFSIWYAGIVLHEFSVHEFVMDVYIYRAKTELSVQGFY